MKRWFMRKMQNQISCLFFSLCRDDRVFTFLEIPRVYSWDKATKTWKFCTRSSSGIGRVRYVPWVAGDIYFLRLMLLYVAGPQSYADLRTVNGFVHPSYREACLALGLLGDDQEYADALNEAVAFQGSPQPRMLFRSLLLFTKVGNPGALWESFKDNMIDGFAHRERVAANDPNLQVEKGPLYVEAL
jgi:hypothetical protein